jgi:hypothetical protein
MYGLGETELERQTREREAAQTEGIVSTLFPPKLPHQLPELVSVSHGGGWLLPLLGAAVAAWFLGGGGKRRSLWLAVLCFLPAMLTAQSVPFKRDVAFGSDTLTVYGTATLTITIDSVVKKYTPPPIITGRPYGPSGLLSAMTQPYTPFTADPGASSNKPAYLLDNLSKAKDRKVSMVANLPCGSHSSANPGNCLVKNSSGVWVFSRARFDSAMKTYNTPAVRAAVDSAYRSGTLVFINLMDEPWVKGSGDGNTWGPLGLTRAQADSLCTTGRATFGPGVPLGTSDWSQWNPTAKTKICDVGLFQFSYRFGQPAMWRDTALTRATQGGYQAAFSFNIINGGTQDKSLPWDCAAEGGIKGQYAPNCQMTPAQTVTSGTALGASGCGVLMMWRYDSTRYAYTGFPAAFTTVAGLQAQRAVTPCKARP